MPLAQDLLAKLQARVDTLMTRRDELQQKRTDEIAKIQAQLNACRTLAQNWQSLPVDQALALVEASGIALRVE